jgi:bifunctional non-homologous end joining protein LigD
MLKTPLRFIEPQLPSLADKPPGTKHWIHEVKHDGYRSLVFIEDGKVRVLTRNGYDWTDRYPGIVRAASNLRCKSAIIDGEAIVQDDNGASDFHALPSAIQSRSDGIILCAFDLLHLDGKDLRQQALSDRRAELHYLLGVDPESRIQFSEEYNGAGAAFLKACANHGLEGIVSKLTIAPYRSGRTTTWLKIRCFIESDFLVIGTDRDRKTGAIRALLAHTESDGLIYAGAAFITLGSGARAKFFSEVERLTTSWAAFKSSRLADVNWCQPKLKVRVKHLAGGKHLRHATVKGLAS